MTSGELIIKVQQELKSLASKLVSVDFENAVDSAETDTGWTLPQTSNYRIRWMLQRTKRHLYDMLRSESAHKFKVEGINLQQRFDHYNTLITEMDKEWENEQESPMDDVSGVAGVKISSSFVYDKVGLDISGDNDSDIYPSEES